MECAVQERQQKIDELLGSAGLATEELEVKEEDQVMETAHVTEPATSPVFGT